VFYYEILNPVFKAKRRIVSPMPEPNVAVIPDSPKGRLNGLDAGFLGLVAVVGLGILLVQSGTHQTSGTLIEGEADIQYTVVTQNTRTLIPTMIRANDMTHLSIRNQPRGDVKIVSATYKPHETSFVSPSGQPFSAVDPALKNSVDYTIVLQDHATVTKEGYVANGIKVKVGLPIELEGKAYRIPAAIIDVRPVSDTPTNQTGIPVVDPVAKPPVPQTVPPVLPAKPVAAPAQ
jgi:Domain of unknown function (DUF4330)